MDKYLLHIIPRYPAALRRLEGNKFINSSGDRWYYEADQLLLKDVLPYVGRTVDGFSLYSINQLTQERVEYTLVATISLLNITPYSYFYDINNNLWVNTGPGVDPSKPILIFFYYISFLDDDLYRLWFSSEQINFTDAPPALPYLKEMGYTLQETLSSFSSVSIIDTDLRLELANPVVQIKNSDPKRYFSNLSRAEGQFLRVHFDDPMFTDAFCHLYRARSDDPKDFLLSPDHASTIWEVVYRGTLRTSLWNYNYLKRNSITATITRSLSQLGGGNLTLDQMSRCSYQTLASNQVMKIFGEMRVRCSVSDYNLFRSEDSENLVWIKVCSGPIEYIKELVVNDSDPIPLDIYNRDGWGVIVDERSGWIGIPYLIIEPYLYEDQENVIDATIFGNLFQHANNNDWKSHPIQTFDSDNPRSRIVRNDEFSYTNTIGTTWTQSNCIASVVDLGSGITGLQMDCTGANAESSILTQKSDFQFFADINMIQIRLRIRGTKPTGFLFYMMTYFGPHSGIRFTGINNLDVDTWYTLQVPISPDEQDIGNGVTAKFSVDNFAIGFMNRFGFLLTGGDGTTYFDIDWFRFFRMGQCATPAEIAEELTYESTIPLADGWPDGSLISQGLDSVRVNDDAEWIQDSTKLFGGNYALKLEPLQNLTLKVPQVFNDEDEILVTVKSSPLRNYPRGAPCILWSTGQNGKVIDPAISIREDEMAIGRAGSDNCYYQTMVFRLPVGAQYFTIHYIPPALPLQLTAVPTGDATPEGNSVPEHLLRSIFRPGSTIFFMPYNSNGIQYQKDDRGTGRSEFSVLNVNASQIQFDDAVTLPNHVVCLNIPLYIGEISLRRNIVRIRESTKDAVDIINPSNIIESNTPTIQLLDQLYQDTGIIPTPVRQGTLDFQVIGVCSLLEKTELISSGKDVNYDPRSVQAVGDIDRLWYNIINAKGNYSHILEDYLTSVGFNATDLKLPQSLFPLTNTVFMRWRRGEFAVYQRAHYLLDSVQEVRAFNFRVLGGLAATVAPGDVLVMPAEEFGFPFLNLVVKTVTSDHVSNQHLSAEVLGVAFHYVLFDEAIRYEAGAAKWDGTYKYC